MFTVWLGEQVDGASWGPGPQSSFRLTSARSSRSRRVTSTWPLSAAQCSGVTPRRSGLPRRTETRAVVGVALVHSVRRKAEQLLHRGQVALRGRPPEVRASADGGRAVESKLQRVKRN